MKQNLPVKRNLRLLRNNGYVCSYETGDGVARAEEGIDEERDHHHQEHLL